MLKQVLLQAYTDILTATNYSLEGFWCQSKPAQMVARKHKYLQQLRLHQKQTGEMNPKTFIYNSQGVIDYTCDSL